MTEGVDFNLFSPHDARKRQTITAGKHGVHLFDNRLTFPRDETGSHLYATRLAPTPSKTLTAVSAISGGSIAPPHPAIVSLSLFPPVVWEG